MPVDAMLETLQISKERYAAIIITPPGAPSRYFSDKMQTALIQAAANKLRRDGVFVTQFHDSPSRCRLLAVILRLGEGFSLFHLLVLNILLWLVLGGLLLIYEPQFGLRNRWIHASLMIAMLAVFTIVLPLQAPTWSIMRRQMRAASVASLQTAVSYIDADRVVVAARASQATAASSPGWGTRTVGDRAQATATALMPVDAMLETLQISKERYAAIIITPPGAPSRYFSDKMQTALIQAAANKLRRDGVFVTQFHDSPSHHEAVFEHWRRQVDRTFGSTEVITESIARAAGPTGSARAGRTRGTRLLIASYHPKQHTPALLSREQALSDGAGGP